MTKPISTRVHGVLDYMTAAFLHTLPRVMGWSPRATALLDTAGVAATAYSVMTRYELGLVRVLPMKTHLTLDAISGAGLIGAALLMEDEDPDVRATIAAIGLWEVGASLLTESRSSRPANKTVREAARKADRNVRKAVLTAAENAGAVQGL